MDGSFAKVYVALMTDAAVTAKPVLVLDFDGTVCVGDAPVWAYAEAIIAELSASDSLSSADLGAAIRAQLSAFLDGTPGSPEHLDGYAAVATLVADHATAEQLQRAYATSRRRLADGTIAVSAPPGLDAFLGELGPHVERVLVTNAPANGIDEILKSIGLSDLIDWIVTDADKPAGWSTLLPQLTAHRPPAAVMAVGDIWGNDLHEPLIAGCATALIDRFGHRTGSAHLTASTFVDLYPGIRKWAADPQGFVDEHQPSTIAPSHNSTAESA